MRKIALSIITVLSSSFLFSQTSLNENASQETVANNVNINYSFASASIANYSKAGHFQMANSHDDCAKWTKVKKAGIGLSIVGGVTLFTGIGMIIADRIILPKPTRKTKTSGMITAGGIIISSAIGIPALVVGIPLAIKGSRKAKQNCENISLNINANHNGAGFALNF